MRDVHFAACGQLEEDARECAMLTADHMPVDTHAIAAHALAYLRTPLWIVPPFRAGAGSVRGGGRRSASPPAPEQARKAPRR
eukprot:14614914-Alexandrium_andersonii.AAC.1